MDTSDGKYLAVGAWGDDNYVKIFEKNGSNYETVGDTIIGEGGLAFGWSIDISADGSTLVIGDYSVDGKKGKVCLYDTFSPSTSLTIVESIKPIFTSMI